MHHYSFRNSFRTGFRAPIAKETKVAKTYTKKGLVKYELFLAGEEGSRSLGSFDKEGRFVMRRDKDKHFHEKVGGYGLNSHLLHKILDRDQPILLKIIRGKEKYELTPRYIIENGTYLHFMEQGFETQIFLPMGKMDKVVV